MKNAATLSKRLLALLLCVCMVLSNVPMHVHADDEAEDFDLLAEIEEQIEVPEAEEVPAVEETPEEEAPEEEAPDAEEAEEAPETVETEPEEGLLPDGYPWDNMTTEALAAYLADETNWAYLASLVRGADAEAYASLLSKLDDVFAAEEAVAWKNFLEALTAEKTVQDVEIDPDSTLPDLMAMSDEVFYAWVMDEANHEQMVEWFENGPRPEYFAILYRVDQIEDTSVQNSIMAYLVTCGFAAQHLAKTANVNRYYSIYSQWDKVYWYKANGEERFRTRYRSEKTNSGDSNLPCGGCSIFALAHAMQWLGVAGSHQGESDWSGALPGEIWDGIYAQKGEDPFIAWENGNGGDIDDFVTYVTSVYNIRKVEGGDLVTALRNGRVAYISRLDYGHYYLAVEVSEDGRYVHIIDSCLRVPYNHDVPVYIMLEDGGFKQIEKTVYDFYFNAYKLDLSPCAVRDDITTYDDGRHEELTDGEVPSPSYSGGEYWVPISQVSSHVIFYLERDYKFNPQDYNNTVEDYLNVYPLSPASGKAVSKITGQLKICKLPTYCMKDGKITVEYTETLATNLLVTGTVTNHIGELWYEVTDGINTGFVYSENVTFIICSHSWSRWAKVDANTHKRTCSQCGIFETSSHSWDNWAKIDTSSHERTCSACGTTDTVSHSWSSWMKVDASSHKRTCSACSTTETASHSWGKWTTIVDAKTHKRTCSICGTSETALHSLGSWTKVNASTYKNTCSVCGVTETTSSPWGSCGKNLIWTLEKGTLTISGTGAMDDYITRSSPWSSFNSSITKIVIEPGVTSIGDEAFNECTYAKTVSIPDSVTSFGLLCFMKCSSLTDVIIPGSVTDMGWGCFYMCSGLNSVTISDGLTSLSSDCFGNCSSLTSIIIPNSITDLESGCFSYCTSLTNITIPNSVTYLSDDCFSGCRSLTNFTIPSSVTSLGDQCFSQCESLTSITIPSSVTYLGNGCFEGCIGLTNITIPNSVTYLGDSLFSRCDNLTNITIPNNFTSLGMDFFEGCSSLTSIIIPSRVTSLGDRCFDGCYNLTNITIPNGVTSLGDRCFGGCYNLTNITIPNGVTSFGWSCFEGCSSLTSITIPGSVTSLGEGCFSRCDGLMDVTFLGDAPQIAGDAFTGVTAAIILTNDTKGWSGVSGQNYGGNLTWKIPAVLSITQQPINQTRMAGQTAFFTVEATGNDLSYQWQFKTPSSTSWAKTTATGYYTATLEIPATVGRNGYQYRCVITDSNGKKLISEAATLTVEQFAITAQPKDVTAQVNATATFTVVASGSNLTYQWQFKAPTSSSWTGTTATGYNTPALRIPATTGRNGYQYRCVITSPGGTKLTSEAAALTVEQFTITGQPKNVTTQVGSVATFTVAVSGSNPTYQWQFKSPTSASWAKTTTTGYNTASLQIPATVSRNGYQYRCIVTDASGNKVTSNAATLTVNSIVIKSQPRNVAAAIGDIAVFAVGATGSGLTYQWYAKSPSGSWSKLSGETEFNLVTVASSRYNGYQYRCELTDASGCKQTTEAATLTLAGITITVQPESVSTAVNGTAYFTISASGTGLTYQWYFKTPTGFSWCKSPLTGSDTASLPVPATTGRNGYQYRCVITDANGNKVTSNPATLTVVK